MQAAETSSLRHYLQVARRHKWVILQALVVVTAAALAFSLSQEKRYEGSTQVLLDRQTISDTLENRVSANDNATLADRIAKTEADLARSPVVARRTIQTLGLTDTTTDDFLKNSSVEPKSNTDILDFNATSGDPDVAKRLATAYAHEFVRYRTELDTAALRKARASLAERIEAAGPDSPLYGRLIAKEEQLRTLEALQTSNATVVETATDAKLVQPLTMRNTIVGAILGLLIGVGLAFLWDALDTRVRSADEVGDALHLPLLARLPEPPRKMRDQNRVLMLAEPRGRQSELFRMLRTNLDFSLIDHDTRTILVTSATQGEGKSTTVANLAVALARGGRRVIAVDLDLRRPFMHRFFGDDSPGVTQVVLGSADLDDALKDVALDDSSTRARPANGRSTVQAGRLQVLVSGPIPPDPGEFLGTRAVTALLDELAQRADIVLVDAPPLLNLGDSLVLSRKVDALMLVTRLRMVRRPMLRELSRILDQVPGHKLGFVVTGADSDAGYGYGYGYGYSSREAVEIDAPLAPLVEGRARDAGTVSEPNGNGGAPQPASAPEPVTPQGAPADAPPAGQHRGAERAERRGWRSTARRFIEGSSDRS